MDPRASNAFRSEEAAPHSSTEQAQFEQFINNLIGDAEAVGVDSLSPAERARREKISERMRFLKELVPGCNMIIGESSVLDEIIACVQRLQSQVGNLCLKLAAGDSKLSFSMDEFTGQQAFDMAGVSLPSEAPSEEEASIKWIEPRVFSSQFMEFIHQDETYKDEGISIDTDPPLNLEVTLEDVVKQKKRMLCQEKVYDLVEASPVEDVGAMIAEPHRSCFQSIKSLPQQEGDEGTIVLEASAHKLVLEDAPQIQNKRLTLDAENVHTDIQFVNKTCEAFTSETEKNLEEDISFESLTKHFGRSLDHTAKSFGVSRSTLKRICRRQGIKRWQSGNRRIGNNNSSNLERRLDYEVPSKMNFSSSGLPPVQDTVVDANTIQEMIKMTVKAMYNGVAIRFKLLDLSGIAELEDNVIERLQLDRKSFSIKYRDDEGDWTLIACDKDVRECMELSRSLKKTTIKMLIDPPIK